PAQTKRESHLSARALVERRPALARLPRKVDTRIPIRRLGSWLEFSSRGLEASQLRLFNRLWMAFALSSFNNSSASRAGSHDEAKGIERPGAEPRDGEQETPHQTFTNLAGGVSHPATFSRPAVESVKSHGRRRPNFESAAGSGSLELAVRADEALPGAPLTLDSLLFASFFFCCTMKNGLSVSLSKWIRLDRFKDCDFVHSGGESCGLAPVPADAAGANLTWATWLRAPGVGTETAPWAADGAIWNESRQLSWWFIFYELCTVSAGVELKSEKCQVVHSLRQLWRPGVVRLAPRALVAPGLPGRVPATDWMRKRLDGVRVVFLGDSTLRGLMFSLFHIANGSLHRWEKSHDTLTLMDRDGRSRMDFSRATGFRENSETDSAHNGTQVEPAAAFNRTVIVIGGAQWLTGAELLQTRELLA
uniref:SGNH domain-containing protein n=1 Tax=Macrostomum lignano TaxID=282301 RepID=A0A1I8FS90_9PLAT